MKQLLDSGKGNPPNPPLIKGGQKSPPSAKGGHKNPPLIKGGHKSPPFAKGDSGGFPSHIGGHRGIFTTGIILLVLALALAACVQPIDRSQVVLAGQDPTPTLEPTPTPTAVPTLRPTPTPTPTPTLAPTATPESTTTPVGVQPLFMDLRQPEFGATVSTRTITVAGTTLPGTTLEVGAQLVRVDPSGNFETQVTLQPGPNVIEIRATGLQGGQIREPLLITYNPPPPPPFRLLVDEPPNLVIVADQPIRVSGSTTVPQAIVTVNGVAVSVDEEGRFSTRVRLTEGANTIEVLALHPDSRTLRATRSVIYSPP